MIILPGSRCVNAKILAVFMSKKAASPKEFFRFLATKLPQFLLLFQP
jgi:hypothetical protein